MASSSLGRSPQPAQWPSEPVPPVGYLSRKALPIKKNDAEALTRVDVQFDLLNYIFSDSKAVFTNQTPGKTTKLTFCDLYVNALFNSTKCSKVLKEKMIETPQFAIELAKISLLTNVGRINTTMAFFPEMKTALRTYHPVPSLQKTDGNAQDAPRIKNCLKAALLPAEIKAVPPSTPEEILERNRAGHTPPTSVVNLIFVLANHAAPLASVHFDSPLNFLDLFLPVNIASADRGRAFLWLIYHYLEKQNTPNPFNDDYSRKHPGKVPWLRRLTEKEQKQENVDSIEEIEWGHRMSAQRNTFLQKLVSSIENEKKARNSNSLHAKEPDLRRSRSYRRGHHMKDDEKFLHYIPDDHRPVSVDPIIRVEPHPQYHRPQMRPYPITRQDRTMLQQAWHIVATTDPLIDSDEEHPDEHVRLDYDRRLQVLNRLRGKSPTPEPPGIGISSQQPVVGIEMRNSFPGRWQEVSWD